MPTDSADFAKTARNTVTRRPTRGQYSRAQVNEILDLARVCHLGFAVEGQPYVIPTSFARDGDELLVHGSSASRTLRALAEPIDVCVTVTLVDGMVMARAAFHHSFNYRSAVVFGRAYALEDPAQKMAALEAYVEKLVPGRWNEIRKPTEQELKATAVLRVPIDEASAKVRTGPPADDEPDYELDVWAGVVPINSEFGAPVPDPMLRPGVPLAPSVGALVEP